jgi:hypothetical protein
MKENHIKFLCQVQNKIIVKLFKHEFHENFIMNVIKDKCLREYLVKYVFIFSFILK